MLNKLLHLTLGTTTNGWEPIHARYEDALRNFADVTFDCFVESLVNLFNMGYVDCYVEEDTDRPINKLTKDELLGHYGGNLSEDEIMSYPNNPVHYFKATQKGIEEEARDIYDAYYPEES